MHDKTNIIKYNQVNLYHILFDHITKLTQTSRYDNKACIRVHNITTYQRHLLITHDQDYKYNYQIKTYNLTQPSKPN